MTVTTAPQCINCPNPAIAVLPYLAPGDEHDHVCPECLAAYHEAIRAQTDSE
ncbi:hypothetical protein [Nocardia takedensis]|uniref:hypothetical protein n=1 Tax=Nocardia takedensis TaxID=259390 RepID=UPI0002E9655B|nr:hypothetical protein [Nocardia takedensis]